MVDRWNLHAADLQRSLEKLNWEECNEQTCLGGLAAMSTLLPEGTKRTKLRLLSEVVPLLKKQPLDQHRISLEVEAVLSYNKRGEKKIACAQLAQFYHSFFQAKVTVGQMNHFIHENVSLIITRRVYSAAKRYMLEIVGALTFSRPKKDKPCYLAYLAVSDGQGQRASLADTKVHILPAGIVAAECTIGYRGYGLGTMLLALLQKILLSDAFGLVTKAPTCYIHYNTHNAGSKEGWSALGFHSLDEAVGDVTINLQLDYEALAQSLAESSIFNASYTDEVNSKVMYRQSVAAAATLPADTTADDARLKLQAERLAAQAAEVKKKEAKEKAAVEKAARKHRKNKADFGLDHDDDEWFSTYEPVRFNKKFKAATETKQYSLAPEEVEAKYDARDKEQDPAPLGFILEMAVERKAFNGTWHIDDPEWNDQAFIDFACLQDPNRTVQVDTESLPEPIGAERLITVVVDSYKLPAGVTLECVADIHNTPALTPVESTINCSWKWLKNEIEPEVALLIHEALFGISVVAGIGLDNPDASVGCRDMATMASFHGNKKFVKGFISPPVAHNFVTLPLNDFGREEKQGPQYEKLDNHAKECRAFEQHVKSLGIAQKPPPLPRVRYQICRLKWIPTDSRRVTDGTRKTRGYYQGAYIVPETSCFSIVSLKDEWVVNEFEPGLLKEIKETAIHGIRTTRKFIPIPPGSSKNQSLPPAALLHFLRNCRFQQGKDSTCLVDCFCSAMYDFGCLKEVEQLRNHPDCVGLNQMNTSVWSDFGNLVNRQFKGVGLQIFRQKNSRSVEDLLTGDDSFVVIALLKSSDGMVGQHAIAIFNGGIYDANCPRVLKKTQKSLDWCCGEGEETCTGIDRSYQLLPTHHKDIRSDMGFMIQRRNEHDCNVRGWVAGTKGKLPKVQFTDGHCCYVSLEELSMFTRLN